MTDSDTVTGPAELDRDGHVSRVTGPWHRAVTAGNVTVTVSTVAASESGGHAGRGESQSHGRQCRGRRPAPGQWPGSGRPGALLARRQARTVPPPPRPPATVTVGP